MTPSPSCPKTHEIEAMLLGQPVVGDPRDLEAHLEFCRECQKYLDHQTAELPYASILKHDAAVTRKVTDSGRDLSSLVHRLEDMARQFTPPGYDLIAPTNAGQNVMAPQDGLDRVGVYRVIRLLGAGGMGLVYLAEDEILCRNVAVKILRPRIASQPHAREGFLREARAVAALKHDNVVTVFHVGEATVPSGEPLPFLAMEFLEGENLASWLRREGPIRMEVAIRIGRQAAEGIAAAHARGVVHRDIKPGNLWLEAPPGWNEQPAHQRAPLPSVARVKVLDFGLAFLVGQGTLGSNREIFGTPDYMAPELASGKGVDHRTDLYSLGVVLYELVTGVRPIQQDPARKQFVYPPPKPVSDFAAEIPPTLADLIHRLLSPAPEDRPKSIRQVIQVLADLETPFAGNTIPNSNELTVIVPVRRRIRNSLLIAFMAVAVAASLVFSIASIWLTSVDKEVRTIPLVEIPEPFAGLGPVDEAWCRAVSKLPVFRQPYVVIAKLRELNPEFNGNVDRIVFNKTVVIEFGFQTDDIKDISPLRALKGLEMLTMVGSKPGKGKLEDLSPIRGCPLVILNIWNNPRLADLSPLRSMSLVQLQAGDTGIEDLSPLEKMPLRLLALNACHVRDLSPVRMMDKIQMLRCDGCPIQSLDPIADSSLTELIVEKDLAKKSFATIEKMSKLEKINHLNIAKFRNQQIASMPHHDE
ncbi:MAG: protein kinase [Gemmataceae bacterium]